MLEPTIINPREPSRWWNKALTLVEGCTRCSAGCRDCWALACEERFGRAVEGGGIRLRWDRLDDPLHWRKPRVVAVWNDLFHPDVPWEFQCGALNNLSIGGHVGILLTKRAERMREFFTSLEDWDPSEATGIILGVTCESNKYLHRVEELVKTPAAVRFVNAHLLGPLDGAVCGLPADGLCPYPCDPCDAEHPCSYRIDWRVIECNRPFRGDPAEWWGWCQPLVEQAVAAGVPVWMKQGPLPSGKVTHDIGKFPPWAQRREFPGQKETTT
jgi:hypothetical protein